MAWYAPCLATAGCSPTHPSAVPSEPPMSASPRASAPSTTRRCGTPATTPERASTAAAPSSCGPSTSSAPCSPRRGPCAHRRDRVLDAGRARRGPPRRDVRPGRRGPRRVARRRPGAGMGKERSAATPVPPDPLDRRRLPVPRRDRLGRDDRRRARPRDRSRGPCRPHADAGGRELPLARRLWLEQFAPTLDDGDRRWLDGWLPRALAAIDRAARPSAQALAQDRGARPDGPFGCMSPRERDEAFQRVLERVIAPSLEAAGFDSRVACRARPAVASASGFAA